MLAGLQIGAGMGVGAAGGGFGPLIFRSKTEGQGGSPPSYPAGFQAGDLLVFVSYHDHSFASDVSPSGWLKVAEFVNNNGQQFVAIWAKIATGGETGTIEDSVSTSSSATYSVYAFELNAASLGSSLDQDAEWSFGAPANQVKNISTIGTAPFVVLAAYTTGATQSVATRGFTGETPDGEEGRTDSEHFLKWFFVASGSGSDITISKGDDGRNGLCSCILELVA